MIFKWGQIIFLKLILVVIPFMLSVGCINPLGSGQSKVDENYNAGTRASLTAKDTSATLNENTESGFIALPYSGSRAVSCIVVDLTHVIVTESCSCISGVCSVKVQGIRDFSGGASFHFFLIDSEGRLSNSALASLTVNAVNHAPLLAPISNQSATAGQAFVVPLTVSDSDSVLVCGHPGTLTATSDQTGLIPTSSIVFGGTAPNCTATITPSANQRGSVNLQFTLSDGLLTSAQSFSVTVANPPTIPTSLSAMPGNAQVSLTWSAPSTGYTPMTYTVYRSTVSGFSYNEVAVCSQLSGTHCIDTTTSNGTIYYYVVRAFNGDGVSGNSNEVSVMSGAPTLLSAITQASRVDLSWTSSTGTTPITYTVQRSTTSGSGYTNVTGCVGISGTTCDDTAVTPGTTYYYIVHASNVAGSASSNEVLVIPMAAPLLAPISNQSATAGQAFVVPLTVSDSDSVLVCGHPGTLTATSDQTGLIPTSSIVFGGTAPNCTATITPSANQRGSVNLQFTLSDGLLTSAQSFSVTVANPPTIPTSLSAMPGNAQVSLTWSAPSTGYTPMTYTVYRSTVSGFSYNEVAVCSQLSGTHCIDTTTSNGTIYYYVVRAFNGDGASGNSNEVSVMSGVPTLLSAITQASRVDLSWTSSTGTTPITYTVQRSTTSGSGYTNVTGCVGISGTTCDDTTATPGTTYYYIIHASNVAGSATSNEVSAIPMAAFTIFLTPGNRQIQVSFSSTGATHYSIQYGTSSGSYSTTLPGLISSPTTISNLVNGTTYYFIVTASNASGSISASSEVSSTPHGPQYFNISLATVGNAQVQLVWNASIGATSYTVQYGTSSGSYETTFATGVTGTSTTVTGLTNGTTYYFMVTALNAHGTQEAGVEFIRTPAQPTLSTINNFSTIHTNSSWSASFPVTLGGLSSLTCDGNITATSSNTSVVSNENLAMTGTYPNCTVTATVNAGVSGSTTMTLTATYGSASDTKSFIFSLLPQAQAVYSVRKAVYGYSGYSMKVQNSINQATADVSFDSYGVIRATSQVTIVSPGTSGYSAGQTMSFSTFYSGANVSVLTWYDQSGNSNDATGYGTSATTYPTIVSSGTLETSNSIASIRFKGNGGYFNMASYPFALASAASVTIVFKNNSSGGWARFFDFGSGLLLYFFGTPSNNVNSRFIIRDSSNGEQGIVNGTNLSSNASNNVLSFIHTGSSMKMFLNGSSIGSQSSITILPSAISGNNNYIGKSQYADSYLNGWYQELVAFGYDLTSYQTTWEANQKLYFGTP